MNFAGKFDAELPVEGSVAHPVAFAHVDGASTHAPSDAIIVPDAQLLFGGDFKRSGVDLVLSKDDHELVLHDYFKGEKRAALASPDGAHLTGDLVNALTGHVEYAQADGAVAAAVVVGHVTKLTGSATAIRNGVSIILNQGDNIDKGDVLQSGADSTLGVTFIDGTVFGLSSNARMVVNEMVYDPNGSNNSSLLSLVAGTISFVAGETAKHGDMKVDTPVATMGIRGTAVLVEIDFAVPGQNDAPSANFQVLVEPDGTTGSYILFDKNTLAPLATVNTPGTLTKISQGVVSFQAGSPLTPDEQKLINDLFTTKFGDNNNTKNTNHAFTDTPVPQSLAPIKLADGTIVTPVIQVVHNSGSGSPSASGGAPGGILHIPGAPTVVTFNDAFTEHANVTGSTALDTQTGQIRFADVNAGDLPTVKVEFSSFIYQDAHHNDITQALSPAEQAAIKAVEAISLQQDPGNNNTGSATWTYSFPDQAFDFLGAGETLTLTYTARVDNNFLQSPEIGTKQFTITITGTNDVPVITSSIPQTIAFVGGTSVPGGDLTAHVPTAGTITFDDPDLTDIHTVSVKLLLDGLKLPPTPLQIFENALTASIATDSTGTGFGKVNWKLADLPVFLADFIPKGETITLTYAVTVTDSQGATSTPQDITVTITGTDTPAVVWIATTSGSSSGGLWSDGSNWETGVAPTANDDAIIITDQLIGLTPSFPVTIDAKTAAVAKSVTMNDFGTSPPKLINLGTLTVSGAFNMSADSVLQNSGGIVIGGGGNFADQSAITNTSTGLIELSGGTLNVQVDIANDGSIKVDSGATLTLDHAAIDGGTINDFSTPPSGSVIAGDIDVTGSSTISNAHLNNGRVTIEANQTLTLDGTTVSGTHFADTADGAIIQIDGDTTLTLSGVTINGGTINDYSPPSSPSGSIIAGDIDITGSSTISNAHLNNGNVTIESGKTLTLTSDTVTGTNFTAGGATILIDGSATLDEVTITGGTITNAGATLTIDAGETLTLQGGASLIGGTLSNSGTLEIEGSSGATLDGITVAGSGSIQVDAAASSATPTLVLDDGTAITDGTLTVGPFGTLAVKTAGGATLNGVHLTNKNSIEVFAGSALTLDQLTMVDNSTGAIAIDGTGMLTLDDAAISGGTVTNNGTLTLDGKTALKSGTLHNYSQINVSSTVNELDSENITNASGIAILALGVLTLDHLTTVDNTGGIITVYGTGKLALNDATINGGTINDYSAAPSPSGSIVAGDIDVTGSSTISGAHLNNGQVTIESGIVLTLDSNTVSGTFFADTADGATIQVDGDTILKLSDVTINGGIINDFSAGASGSIIAGDIDITGSSTISGAHLNNGQVTIESGVVLTLDNDTVTGTHFTDTADGATIQIDGGTTLKLDGVTIDGGTINDFSAPSSPSGSIVAGDIDVIGSSIISDAHLNHGNVTIESNQKLTLDNVIVNGTTITAETSGSIIQIDSPDRLTLEGGATIQGGSGVQGAIGNAGTIEVAGAATLLDVTLTNTASGSIVQIDGGDTLTLNGAGITGGTINNFSTGGSGTIDVTDDSTISNATLNSGNVTVEGATLTLDNVTVNGTTITEETTGSIIQIDSPDRLTLEGGATIEGGSGVQGAIGNAGTIEVAGVATLLDVTLTNTASGSLVQIDGGDTLTLFDAEMTGGTINNFSTVGSGTIDVLGDSTISNATLNSGNVTVEGATLTLDNVTVNGTTITEETSGSIIQIDSLTLEGGAAIQGGSGVQGAIGNAGTIEVAGAATLLDVTLTNTTSGSIVQIDSGDTLTLNGAGITGGTINNFSANGSGTIDVTDDSMISNAALNGGHVTVEGATLTLDNVTVNGTTITEETTGSIIQIDSPDRLTLEGGATIQGGSGVQGAIGNAGTIEVAGAATLLDVTLTNTASGSIVQIDSGDTLTLNDAGITGGTINNFSAGGSGTIDVTDDSTISNAALNGGNVTVESATLTLDNVTVSGTTITDETSGSIIQIDSPDRLTLEGGATIQGGSGVQGAIGNAGTIEVAGAATLLDVTLTNTASGSIVQIDSGDTLTLNGAGITGGTINNFSAGGSGTIDVTDDSTISNAALNGGNVTVESATLTLDNVTVSGTTITDETSGSIIQIDSPDRLTLEGGATIQGGSGVQGAIGNAGTIEVAGAATLLDATLTNTASGSIVQIDSGDTLTLNDAGITGGTINNFSAGGSGTIDVTDDSTISNAALNGGNVTVEGATLTLDNVTVNGTTITAESSSNTIQIDSSDTLTLEGGATIQGGSHVQGAIGGAGAVEVAGAATLLDVTLTESDVTVESATLTLDNVIVDTATITEETSGSIIQIDSPDRLTLEFGAQILGGPAVQGAISNAGTIVVAGSASLFDVTLTNTASGSIVQIDGHATLTLNDAEITGGTINNFSTGGSGTIDVMGDTTISNATLNSGNVTVEGAPLTLDNVTVNGTSITEEIFSGGVIQIDGATGDTVTLNGVSITGVGLNVAAHGLVQTNGNVTLTNTGVTNDGTIEVTGGTLTITGTGSVADSHGNTGGTIQIDGGAVLDLNVSDTQNVSFSGTGGEFKIDTVGFGGNISGLAAGDEIDLSTIGYGPGTTATYVSNTDNTGGTLNVTNGQHSIALQLVGDYSGAHFAGSVDSAGDTLITLNAIDDTPTITATGGSLAEAANVTNIGATDKASGSITFSDIDLTDRPTVTTSFASFDYKDAAGDDLTLTLTPAQQAAIVALETGLALSPDAANANNGTVGWSYSATDSALDFMAAGDKLVLTYNATVNDGAGDTVTTPVTVTITGSDDAPAVSFAPAYLQFNGHSAAVGPVATTNIGNGTDGVTLDGWVNWNGIGDTSHGQILFYNGNTSTAGFGMFSVPTAGGSLDLEILAGGETVIDTGIKLTAGQWYNVALSHVNDIFTLDVDGAVVYTSGPQGAFTMGHLDTPDFTLIGGNSGGTEGFNGGIADVSVWNTALSQSQVQAIEFGTLSGTEPGLAAYYALNDGSGTTATDAVNSAGNLSFVGNPAWQTSGSWPDSSVSIAENHAVTIEGISVNDVDAGSSQIEVTLAAGHGSLSLANSAGLDSVQTNSDGSVDLFGSQAAIDTALSHGVIYTPVTDFSGSDTLTVSANDQVSAALGGPLTGTAHITLNVEPGTPVFNSMTLTIAQGGTDVLTDANFSISDPDTSHFLYTVNNVTGGQFEVFNGTNWVSAPTGGFTTAQIEAGHVEFVQDGSATAPDFSIFATDGTNASAAIAPTINFTLTPPVAHDDVISGPTGTGWVLDTDNGHYYREVETHGSFEAAVAGAVADGGYLATITSAAEQSFVVNHVINGFDATWLGGETTTDRPDGTTVNTSVWSWVTGPEAGTQFSYTNWNPGEPSGGFNATTQWLQIGPTGGWNDAPDAGQPGDGNGAGYLEEWGGSSGQITFLENTGTTIATSVLLANDTDVNGFTLTVTAVGDTNGHSAQGGTVSLNGDIITYTPSTGHSGEDSFTYTISDGSQTSTATVSFDVAADVAPVLNSMTLTVAQGGAEVLTDANFNVTDPDSASFLYTVNNVTGGQFDVFNGTSWVSAPTGGFTTAQIEAGHVEFVQDGSAAVPNFSISVSDGINASAAVAPTVNFTPAHSGNLIVNGGFETNDFTGWTVGGDNAGGNHAEVGTGANQNLGDAPNHGLAEALLGGSGGDVTLSQTIATTAGEHYTVDFWLMNDASGNSNNSFGNDFSATWNGVALTTLTTDPGSTYTEYQFDVVGAANATQSTLQFSAQTGTGSWGLDDVSVLQGAPNTVQQMSDATTAVSGVNATDTLTVTPPQNALGTVSATAGNGTVEWQFQATNAQLDHLMGLTQSFTVTDTTNPSATQTVAVSVGGNGNDQFVFHQGVGADTMVNFSTLTTPQGTYAGDTIALESFNGITGVADVLTHLGADSHGNAVVDLGNHDSITFQGLSVAQISANASHIFQV